MVSRECLTRPALYSAGNVAAFAADGSVADTGVRVDDSSPPSTSAAYTSAGVERLVNEKAAEYVKRMPPGSAVPKSLLTVNAAGQLESLPLTVDDSAAPNRNILWSSKKVDSVVSDLESRCMRPVPATVTPGTVLVADGSGGADGGRGLSVDDAARPSPSVLWSSERVESHFREQSEAVGRLVREEAELLSGYVSAVQDTTRRVDAANAALAAKIPVVRGAPEGNIAVFARDGTLADSGIRAGDSLPASDSVLWSSSKIEGEIKKTGAEALERYEKCARMVDDARNAAVAVYERDFVKRPANVVPGNLVTIQSDGTVRDLGMRVDDSSEPSSGAVWSSEKVARVEADIAARCEAAEKMADRIERLSATRMKKIVGGRVGNLVRVGDGGQAEDSGLAVDDDRVSTDTVWTSQKTFDALKNLARMKPGRPGNLAVFDADNTVTDSGLSLDDSRAGADNVWSARRILDVVRSIPVGPKFFMSAHLTGGLTIDSKSVYAPEFSVDACSDQELVGVRASEVQLPYTGWYYQTLDGSFDAADPAVRVVFRFPSGTVDCVAVAGRVPVNVSSADSFKAGQSLHVSVTCSAEVTTPSRKHIRYIVAQV